MPPVLKEHVYMLADPSGVSEDMYIGLTTNPAARLRDHLQRARHGNGPVAAWLRSLFDRNVQPCMTILESVKAGMGMVAERFWIERYRSSGVVLLNESRGGEHAPPRRYRSLIGRTFGRLIVTADAEQDNAYRRRWSVRCSCGVTKDVDQYALTRGHVRSCGCLSRDQIIARSTTHGGFHDREYVIWSQMIARCENPHSQKFDRYGGRGIAVCKRWRRSYAAFRNDVGPMPSPKHTLERIDNNLGYAPSNCRWATRREQANNRENTLFVEFHGKRVSVADLARKYDLSYYTLRMRLRRGWPLAKALSVSPKIGGHYGWNRHAWSARNERRAQEGMRPSRRAPTTTRVESSRGEVG